MLLDNIFKEIQGFSSKAITNIYNKFSGKTGKIDKIFEIFQGIFENEH